MKNARTYMGFFLLVGFILSCSNQYRLRQADKKYDNYEYISAIEIYEKVAEKGYKTPEMLERLGNSYYFNARYTKAVRWYEELLELQPENDNPEYYYRYSMSLKSMEEYDKANQYLEKYYQKRGEEMPEIVTYLDVIEANSGRYEIKNAGSLNSEYSDFGTTFLDDQLIFASSRRGRQAGWNEQAYTTLYASKKNKNGNMTSAKVFLKEINTKVHESTPVFTKDKQTVYFTRNNFLKRLGRDKDQTTRLKIYRASFKKGKWTDVEELPFNNDNYSVAHPALSPDEKTLYFVSDMPGTFGKSDIWKVQIRRDGSFGEPENLGPTINTPERESFPFVSPENELYYASDGKLGLGGFDVFVSKINEDQTHGEAINVGSPINGPNDDFGFYIDSERTGFFTSNRSGGKGDDDIYQFVELRGLGCTQLIAGLITDAHTQEPIPQAKVSLFDEDGEFITAIFADCEGKYSFDEDLLECDVAYRVRAEKPYYSTEEEYVRTSEISKESVVDLALNSNRFRLEVGADLGKFLNVVIYFDLDKWNIRLDAAIELVKILQVMQEYPQVKVDIRSHTDSRQSYKYNEILSDRRAKSTRDWLVRSGIAPARLTAKGYGKTQLVNKCSDGVDCTEEEHQANRRSEFIIVGIEQQRHIVSRGGAFD